MAKFLDINLKVNLRPLILATQQQIKNVNELPTVGFKYFKSITPIGKPSTWKNPKNATQGYQPGNARRNTTLANRTIRANYAYAYRLDKMRGPGRSRWSKQAPRGMTEPTRQFILARYNRIFGRK